MTEVVFWIDGVGLLLCLAMIGHALMSRQPAPPAGQCSLTWALLVALLVFLAIWVWFIPGIYLLVWAAWFGDNMPRWFERACPLMAAGLALIYPGWIALTRVLTGRASRRYLQIRFAAASALLVLMGAIHIYEWASRIYGATPLAAANEYLEKFQPSADDTEYRLVEESRSGKAESGGPQWVSYKIVGRPSFFGPSGFYVGAGSRSRPPQWK